MLRSFTPQLALCAPPINFMAARWPLGWRLAFLYTPVTRYTSDALSGIVLHDSFKSTSQVSVFLDIMFYTMTRQLALLGMCLATVLWMIT